MLSLHAAPRTGKQNDVLLLAPPNTPLQYPIRGFRVSPLNKTLIPDINSLVTVLVKAFLRYKELKVLIESIRVNYPNIKIIIADDSHDPEKIDGDNIEHYIMPPAQGWFAGRNLAVSQVTTKYFLWVDDDFVFLNETRIESFVKIMEAAPELDVVGGEVDGNRFAFKLVYQEGNSDEGGCITRVRATHGPVPGLNKCFFVDGLVNYFMARTDAVRRRVVTRSSLKRERTKVGNGRATGDIEEDIDRKAASLLSSSDPEIIRDLFELRLRDQ
ncbi:Beta-1,4 N-acetylgalactosaminyltransferase 1 [Triplophysa tibetana]|uniref:Beta-1,4 N-acetylgalactosaminyltransferase 1 n=1 Tax=Triplophysa tibetana TaxID=1572043 RepID=A0A5A9PWB3_9TELE|nr:Beta-1,4 N-acetylgalactosaminyltransferase 1 [Triplophysa tibetana]